MRTVILTRQKIKVQGFKNNNNNKSWNQSIILIPLEIMKKL